MSDLVIGSGAVVAVDTASLRDAARGVEALAAEVHEATAAVRRAQELVDLAGSAGTDAALELLRLRAGVEGAAAEGEALARALRDMADVYEAVELLAHRDAAAAAGDAARVARLDRRLAILTDHHPGLTAEAWALLLSPRYPHGELMSQAVLGSLAAGPLGGMIPLTLFGALAAFDMSGRGRVGAYERLSGPPQPVAVTPVATADVAPPANLADAAKRIPGGGDARVRVERYVLPSGEVQFAVYVAGTQTWNPGTVDPFDVQGNVELAVGVRSAAYDAVVAALEAAGARPGDAVHAFGHSQGGMIVERLANEGTYDLRSLTTFGSPVQADVGPGTLAVSVRHTDDPVAALQGGGHAGGVGTPGGFTASRPADPLPGAHDAQLGAHAMTAYVETARRIDGSTDPRVDNLRASVFDVLATARSGQETDYAAARVAPPREGGR